MAKRLVEKYQINDVVEIKMKNEAWVTAIVVAQQHPGIWARTTRSEHWFVTNANHIRFVDQAEE